MLNLPQLSHALMGLGLSAASLLSSTSGAADADVHVGISAPATVFLLAPMPLDEDCKCVAKSEVTGDPVGIVDGKLIYDIEQDLAAPEDTNGKCDAGNCMPEPCKASQTFRAEIFVEGNFWIAEGDENGGIGVKDIGDKDHDPEIKIVLTRECGADPMHPKSITHSINIHKFNQTSTPGDLIASNDPLMMKLDCHGCEGATR